MGLILAFDVGTSRLRTGLFDPRGRAVAGSQATAAYPLLDRAPGQAELAPAALLRAARKSLGHTLEWQAASPRYRRREITSVGMSCFWHSLMGIDAEGRPLTPIFTWADARCRDYASRLRAEFDVAELHQRTGCMLHTSFWPAKLEWLRCEHRTVFRRVYRWLSPGEWLYQELCGNSSCAHAMATGTGLYDPTAQQWDRELLERFSVSAEQVAELDDGPAAPGKLQRGLENLASARWCPAIGDGAASNLGSGATEPGTLAINLGSSAGARELRTGSRCKAPLGLFAYRLDRRRYLVGGAISNAGNLRAWCVRELGLDADPRRLDRLLARRKRPDHGLILLPFWTAERAPSWRDDMTGVVYGLTSATSALDILRAAIETGHYRLGQILALMRIRAETRLVASGGGSRGKVNQQRLADVLGRPVFFCAEAEASLRGAAVRALELTGGHPGWRGPVEPDRALHTLHRSRAKKQQALERQLYPADPSHGSPASSVS